MYKSLCKPKKDSHLEKLKYLGDSQMLHKHVPWRDNIIMFDTSCLQFYVSELASLLQSLPSQIKPEQTVILTVDFSIKTIHLLNRRLYA